MVLGFGLVITNFIYGFWTIKMNTKIWWQNVNDLQNLIQGENVKESEIRDEIFEYLKKRGIMIWKDRQYVGKPGKVGARNNGLPDLMGILSDGTFFGIEVKKPGEKMRPDQKEFQERALERGAMCFVAYSLEDVEKRFL